MAIKTIKETIKELRETLCEVGPERLAKGAYDSAEKNDEGGWVDTHCLFGWASRVLDTDAFVVAEKGQSPFASWLHGKALETFPQLTDYTDDKDVGEYINQGNWGFVVNDKLGYDAVVQLLADVEESAPDEPALNFDPSDECDPNHPDYSAYDCEEEEEYEDEEDEEDEDLCDCDECVRYRKNNE